MAQQQSVSEANKSSIVRLINICADEYNSKNGVNYGITATDATKTTMAETGLHQTQNILAIAMQYAYHRTLCASSSSDSEEKKALPPEYQQPCVKLEACDILNASPI
eukprot:CAMPEP_0197035756 /NCGR_PEP_ID=MMETSP1384-20130603/13464_1 /TAXON_ID=29189 /ORGANISM="Ammonia sp." /LENGTH=106 /DNA_ID=CAMNT_0042465853 /DNA_START=35 /DNA_END=356 /DNA_ORIENTATION=-